MASQPACSSWYGSPQSAGGGEGAGGAGGLGGLGAVKGGAGGGMVAGLTQRRPEPGAAGTIPNSSHGCWQQSGASEAFHVPPSSSQATCCSAAGYGQVGGGLGGGGDGLGGG